MFEIETTRAFGRTHAEARERTPADGGDTDGDAGGAARRDDRSPLEPLEVSLVEAVLAACELTEDETEVRDRVDALVRRPEVRLVAERQTPLRARPTGRIRHRAA